MKKMEDKTGVGGDTIIAFFWYVEQIEKRRKRRSAFLFLQLGPARVKRVHLFLGFFQFRVGGDKARTVADDLGIFKLDTFGLQYLLGVGNALLDRVIFSRLQVRQLL